jgi:HD-GYP domain-containing protein (c-di-GMP phosphodiesterase class II)
MASLTKGSARQVLAQFAASLADLFPPGRLGKYILIVGLVGLGMFGYAVTQLSLQAIGILAMLFVLTCLAEWAPIKLAGTPLQGSSLSVSAAFAFAALLILGLPASIIVNLGSALAYTLKEKRPFFKRLLTTATLVNSSAFAGLVYLRAGGQTPMALDARTLLAAGVAAGVYFLTDSSLISGAVSLQTGHPFSSVLANWQWLFLQMLTSLAVGLVMALAYISPLGSPGFVLVSLLLIFPWYSIYFYVQKSRQVSEQNEEIKKANAGLEEANRALDLRVKSLWALHNIGISLNSTQALQDILHQILASVQNLEGADTSAIFLDQNGERVEIAGQVGLSSQYLAAPEMALDGPADRALRQGDVLVMDKDHYMPAMLSAAAEREGIQAVACLPLRVAGEVVGALDVCWKSEHAFSEDELNLLRTLAEQAAVAVHNARLMQQVHEGYLSTIHALSATVEAKDPYTRGHSEVVRQLAVATGRQLNLSSQQIEVLSLAALFHDIGKIGIPESILGKPGPLSKEEWPIMQEHSLIGEYILSKVPALADLHSIVRDHHERVDGQGYPNGTFAEQNLLAAIISVCDAFQAMISDRPYRKAFPSSYAIEELRRGSGTQFVPRVVDAFITAESRDPVHLEVYHTEPKFLLRRKILSSSNHESVPALQANETP